MEILASRYNIEPDHIDWMNKIIDETNDLFIKPQEVCMIYQLLTQVWADHPKKECYTVISRDILHHVKDFAIREVFDKITTNLP